MDATLASVARLVPLIARMAEKERAAERAMDDGDAVEFARAVALLVAIYAEIGEVLHDLLS